MKNEAEFKPEKMSETTNNDEHIAMWHDISTAPKDGTRVLVFGNEGVDVAKYIESWSEHQEYVRTAKDGDVYRTIKQDNGYWETDIAYCPTHWMPMPPAPNQEAPEIPGFEGTRSALDGLGSKDGGRL